MRLSGWAYGTTSLLGEYVWSVSSPLLKASGRAFVPLGAWCMHVYALRVGVYLQISRHVGDRFMKALFCGTSRLYYYSICTKLLFLNICTLFPGARGSFLALPTAGHAGGPAGYAGAPPVHHGASLGLERAPWRVIWAFKVAKSGK